MDARTPTVADVAAAYDAVAERHDQAAAMHADAYAAAAPQPDAGVSAYGVETGPADE